jgi:DNA polymerase III subunit beta
MIRLELDPQSLVLNIRSGRYEANLHGISAQDFPNVPALAENPAESLTEAGHQRSELTMLASDLKEAVGQVVMVASSDESRPVLTGVLAGFEGERVTLAAADSFRLAVKVAPLVGSAPNLISIIIPGRALAELGRILTDSEHSRR